MHSQRCVAPDSASDAPPACPAWSGLVGRERLQAQRILHLSGAVAQRLRVRDAPPDGPTAEPRDDIHAYFAILYHHSTRRNFDYAATARVPPFYYRLIAEFYRLYIASVVRRVAARTAHRRTPLWNAYFAAAASARVLAGIERAVPVLIAGARAHILGDLPVALVRSYRHVRRHHAPSLRFDDLAADFFDPRNGPLFTTVTSDFLAELAACWTIPVPKPVRQLAIRCASPFLLPVSDILAWRGMAWRQAATSLDSTAAGAAADATDRIATAIRYA